MRKILLSTLLLFASYSIMAQGQQHESDINIEIPKKELKDVTTFTIKNINGNLKVKGYEGSEIKISGTKIIRSKKGKITKEEIEEYYLTSVQKGEVMYAYIQAPGVEVEFDDDEELNLHVNWPKDRKYKHLNFSFDLEVLIPRGLYLNASTINGGQVLVENMNRRVEASNVNGSVIMKGVSGDSEANTVNGDIEVWFDDSPTQDLQFKTVNGDIEINSPKNLSAIVTFESLHGDLYTNFENVKRMPNQMTKEESKRGKHFKIGSTAPIQIGEGGPTILIKMVNGSAYIKERKS